MRKCLPMVLSMLLLTTAVCRSDAQAGSKPSEYTEIRAVIVGVNHLTFPRARLELRITESTNPKVFDPKSSSSALMAENYLWCTDGHVDFLDKRNMDSIGAYYLLQGDLIRAKLYRGAGRAPGWYAYDISRVVAPDSQARGGAEMQDGKTTGLQSSLSVEAEVEKPVNLVLTLKNTGSQPKTFQFASSQKYDFIAALAGREIWRWSHDRMFTQALTMLKLSPGESVSFRGAWPQVDNDGKKVGPGEYRVSAVLTTMGAPQETVGTTMVTVRGKS